MIIPDAILQWIEAERSICSAVHFGSGASDDPATADAWSDVDLHIVTSDAAGLLRVDWAAVLPELGFCFQVVREATGGVRKLTVVYASGQMDLILVPRAQMRLACWGMALGMHAWHRRLSIALDEMHTCLRSGYEFLKGEKEWGRFYQRVTTGMSGVRLDDAAIRALADGAVLDVLWVWQKIARGEYCAAQHVLHCSVANTNFRLIRELRLRRGQSLPSFGLGRRVEVLLSDVELSWVKVEARPNAEELRTATLRAARGLSALMRELMPTWDFPTLPDVAWLQANASN